MSDDNRCYSRGHIFHNCDAMFEFERLKQESNLTEEDVECCLNFLKKDILLNVHMYKKEYKVKDFERVFSLASTTFLDWIVNGLPESMEEYCERVSEN